MVANQVQDLPPDIRKTQRNFERWRNSHTGRRPIPEQLWAAAADLARVYGVCRIANALRLEYGKLKDLSGVAKNMPANKTPAALPRTTTLSRTRTRHLPPAFVELIAPNPRGTSLECRVELEGRRGKMRIEFKGIATAELVALSRALWDGEA